jgi:hypothetical protein
MDAADAREPVKIGYWARSPDDPSLPYPQAGSEPWARQGAFVAGLRDIEQDIRTRRKGRLTGYRGFSMCRLCAAPNGSEEFEWSGYCWPSGLLHYVEAHNVQPPAAFLEVVLALRE